MLRVHKCGHATSFLGLGDHLQRDRGFARRLRPEDFDYAAARKPAHTERCVERNRARRNDRDGDNGFLRSQSHDRALAKLLFDLRKRQINRLGSFIGHERSSLEMLGCLLPNYILGLQRRKGESKRDQWKRFPNWGGTVEGSRGSGGKYGRPEWTRTIDFIMLCGLDCVIPQSVICFGLPRPRMVTTPTQGGKAWHPITGRFPVLWYSCFSSRVPRQYPPFQWRALLLAMRKSRFCKSRSSMMHSVKHPPCRKTGAMLRSSNTAENGSCSTLATTLTFLRRT